MRFSALILTLLANGLFGQTLTRPEVGAKSRSAQSRANEFPHSTDFTNASAAIAALTGKNGGRMSNIMIPAGTSDSSFSTWPDVEFGVLPGDGFSTPLSKDTQISDYRYGEFSAANARGKTPTMNSWTWNRYNAIYTDVGVHPGQNYNLQSLNLMALHGGSNLNYGAYNNKSYYVPADNNMHCYTPGQCLSNRSFLWHYSTGDALLQYGIMFTYGGYNTGSDEGAETFDLQTIAGTDQTECTISAVSGNNVTLSPCTYGAGHIGDMRFILNTTSRNSTTISSIVQPPDLNTPLAINVAANFFGASTVSTLGTAVTAPGTATVTPASITGFATGSIVCVFPKGAGQIEWVQITTSGSSFAANFRYPHASTDGIATGGAVGSFIRLVADTFTVAEFAGASYAPQNDLWRVFPVLFSNNTQIFIGNSSPSGYQALITRASSSVGNAVEFFYGAEVTDVTNGTQTLSSTVTHGPSTIAWAAGNTIVVPHYPSAFHPYGIFNRQLAFPDSNNGGPGQMTLYTGGTTNGLNPPMMTFWNNSPTSYYAGDASHTAQTRPNAISFDGPGGWNRFIYFPSAPATSALFTDFSATVNFLGQYDGLNDNGYVQGNGASHQWNFVSAAYGISLTHDYHVGSTIMKGQATLGGLLTNDGQFEYSPAKGVGALLTITASGTGYTKDFVLIFTGGACTTPPQGEAHVYLGAVVSADFFIKGAGCTSAPAVSTANGTGTGATIAATISTGDAQPVLRSANASGQALLNLYDNKTTLRYQFGLSGGSFILYDAAAGGQSISIGPNLGEARFSAATKFRLCSGQVGACASILDVGSTGALNAAGNINSPSITTNSLQIGGVSFAPSSNSNTYSFLTGITVTTGSTTCTVLPCTFSYVTGVTSASTGITLSRGVIQ